MANIKIQDVAQRIQYTATASQTEFAIPFPFFENSDIVFYQGETLLVQGTGTDEYAVAGANTASGGTATLVTGAIASDVITISGATPIDRTSIYSATISNLTGSDLNNDFNRDIVISKQIETTQELLQMQYAPYTEVSQDPTVTVDRWLPKLGANQVWAMNAGVTEIVPYDLSATGGLVNTVVGTANQIDVDSTDGTNPVLSLSSTLIAPGTIQSGNIKVNGNTITSEDTNGDVNLTPNGTGDLVLDSVKWPQADGTVNQVLTTDGAGNTSWVDTGSGGGGGNVGDFVDFGGTSLPAGCLLRDGAAVSRTTYSALFAVISTTWGAGDGSTTFNLPNSERSVSVGSGGTGTATLGNSVGDTGGSETHTLTTAEMPAHIHPNVIAGVGGGDSLVSGSGTAVGGNTGSTGGDTAHTIMQPSLVMLPCIRYEAVAATVAVAATQAQMESASSSTIFSAPAVQQYHPSAAKGWVYYNQLTGPSVVASYNVTSVTDNGVGIYTVNWATDFSDANYSAVATCPSAGGGNNLIGVGSTARAAGTSQFTVIQLTSQIDLNSHSVVAYGEQV